jgi:hypothetical protein
VKVDPELALLASCESVEFVDEDGQEWQIDFDEGKFGLFCNGDEDALFILPVHKAKAITVPKGKRGLKDAYLSFTGYEVNDGLSFEIPKSRRTLQPIGTMQRVIYLSDKWNRKPTRYGHEYETEVTMYADRDTPSASRVFGARADSGRRLVSKRGLIG